MTVGNIAALIATLAFCVLVGIAALPLIKLGKVFDELRCSIKDVTEHANDTLIEANRAVRDTSAQIQRVDAVTTSAAQVSQDISALSALTTATLGAPLIKLAAFSHGVRSVLRVKKK